MAAEHLDFWNRYCLEKGFKQVEIMMDYKDIMNISALSGKSEQETLKSLKEHGLTTVLFKEMTVEDIERYEQVAVFTGGQLQGMASLSAGVPGWWQQLAKEHDAGTSEPVRLGSKYLLFQDKQSFNRVAGQLAVKTKNLQLYDQAAGMYIIETPWPQSVLKKVGLGFSEQKLQLVEQAGLSTMVQIRSWPQVTPQGLQAVFEPLADITDLSGVLFNDHAIPGVDEKLLPELAANIRDIANPAVVAVEFFPSRD